MLHSLLKRFPALALVAVALNGCTLLDRVISLHDNPLSSAA
jgi:hypothetical protein